MTAGFSMRRRVRAAFAAAVFAALLFALVGLVAFLGLLDAREGVVDQADPAMLASSQLLAGLVDQETGVRAYVLSADESYLAPYEQGDTLAEVAREDLQELTAELPAEVRDELAGVDAAIAAWQEGYVEPTVDGVQTGDPAVRGEASLEEGRARFEAIRASIGSLQETLDAAREDARDRLSTMTVRLVVVLGGAAVVLIAVVGFLWRLVRRDVEDPLERLGDHARQVAEGDLDHLVEPVGPAELQALGTAMEKMRQRIVDDLAAVTEARDALETQARELERSNAELEQFAYVASHDLQEPLRKVASFCQLLQSRYRGQLDERADQYIEFAVDGAKRMQTLINDLLAFSRVSRLSGDVVEVDADDLVKQALENLSDAVDEAEADVTVESLPRVRVEESLGVALFQNLISNAVKFRSPGIPPVIRISARRVEDFHEFAVRDNGIGIPEEYADRIFVIFQRLHTKDEYAGTGIGLALSRKIVDHHGGRIWVERNDGPEGPDGPGLGTTVRFTLPAVQGDP